MERHVFSRAHARRHAVIATLVGLIVLAAGQPVVAEARSKAIDAELRKAPLDKMSVSIGAPNAGSQVRAKRLKGSPQLVVLKKSADHAFGHPALVLMLQRSAKQIARSFPGSKLVVGDLSSRDGGPLAGHHSHQSGRDADIVFFARDAKGKQVVPKHFVPYGADGKATDDSGLVFDDERNWNLVQSWAKDHRADLQYIFVSRALKARLLAFAAKNPRSKKIIPEVAPLFLEPENAEPHNDHFHVRIKCPKAQEKVCRDPS